MPMKKMVAAESPAAYVAGLSGWRRALVMKLRRAVRGSAHFTEAVKWGHLVYLTQGPVLLIRAEDARVLFGFWRGKRLRALEPRLKASGKYEMATIEFREGMTIAESDTRRLAAAAAKLNAELGDPTKIARRR